MPAPAALYLRSPEGSFDAAVASSSTAIANAQSSPDTMMAVDSAAPTHHDKAPQQPSVPATNPMGSPSTSSSSSPQQQSQQQPPSALSTKIPSSSSSSSQPSLLERLPAELRLQIYEALFPDISPIPAHPLPARGALRADAVPTSARILQLNRALCAEAQALLYRRAAFAVRIHPGGISLCGGRAMTYPDFDFGKRSSSSSSGSGAADVCAATVVPMEREWRAWARGVRRIEVTVSAWCQCALFAAVRAYVDHFVARLTAPGCAAATGCLTDVRIDVEWHNGSTNFPVTHPTPQMARDLLEPFGRLKGLRSVVVGNVGTPRYFFGAPAVAVVEEGAYRELKEELRARMMARA